MKAIFYTHERVLQLLGPIATGILRGLASQATKKKQLRSCEHSTSTSNAYLTARRARYREEKLGARATDFS